MVRAGGGRLPEQVSGMVRAAAAARGGRGQAPEDRGHGAPAAGRGTAASKTASRNGLVLLSLV